MTFQVNYFAVFVAAIAEMVVGFVWYSPALFGKLWMKIIGKDKLSKAESEQMRKETKPYFGIIFLGTLIGAFVLARFIGWLGVSTVGGGLYIAFWAWLGFAFPFALGQALFSGRDESLIWHMFGVQVGHQLVGMLVMGAILGAWM